MRLSARRRAEPVELASAAGRHVYTVDPGRPFLTALAEALLAGDLPVPGGARPDPLQLADITLYLPARRATRALQEAFLKASKGRALLLPRIKLIGEGNEDLDLVSGTENFGAGGGDLPAAIGEIERQLALTTLVLRWAELQRQGGRRGEELLPYAATGARTPAQAARLARELARLIDTLETEGIDLARLSALVPEEYSEHWSRTLAFLEIVMQFWPAHLAERNLLSVAERRRRLLAADAERLEAGAGNTPTIVAGVTQADAAAAGLIEAAIAQPNGALVLPALDQTLDDRSWASIADHPEHPQFGLKKLIDALQLSRRDIQPLGGTRRSSVHRARWALACEAMRPAGTTDLWHRFAAAANKAEMAAALTGVSSIEAATAEEEAETVALILREVVETPGRTAMLVSPDRTLSRRVSARLAVWGLDIDDQGGEPFAMTGPGAFLELVATAAHRQFEPVALMSLLKHPLCRVGMSADGVRSARDALELACLRSPYFGKGLDGVEAALERAQTQSWRHPAVRRLGGAEWRAARDLVQRLRRAFQPTTEAFASTGPASLGALAGAHYATAQNLARTSEKDDGGAPAPGRGRRVGDRVLRQPARPGHAGPRHGGSRLLRFLPDAGCGKEHPPAGLRPSAPIHLRSVRRAAAAGRRRDPRLAQRRHLAQGCRSRSLAQPSHAPGPRPAGARGAHRRGGTRLRLPAGCGACGADTRHQGRWGANGRVALAPAAAGPGAGHRPVAPSRAALARLGAGAQRRRRQGTAGARARAQAARWQRGRASSA